METIVGGPWQRPRSLMRLCVLSFIDQGVVFPIYLFGLLSAFIMHSMSAEEVQHMLDGVPANLVSSAQRQALVPYMDMLRLHGVALMGIFALRTVARFIGTLRMWNGRNDGLHIYITAQLLGMLLPIMIAGSKTLDFLGFIIALNWCYLYFTQRKALR
ncbi:MAG: hypothetical protein ABI373_02305 [Flavobacteriales bacterium]